MLLTEKTKEATLQEKLNKKRNLFGLGLTSLIAACGADKAAGGSGDDPNPNPNPNPNPEPDPPLPFNLSSDQELTSLDPFTSSEYTAEVVVGSDASTLTAQITYTARNNNLVTDNIVGAEFRQGSSHANLYKFENDASSSSFNLVVAAPFEHEATDEANALYRSGIVKVYWGLTPDSTSLDSGGSLTINGIKKSQIGKHAIAGKGAPEFFLLGTSSTKKYDMLIASNYFIGTDPEDVDNTGAIHILWDVADYSGSTKTINLGNLADTNVGATSGSLTIYDGADSFASTDKKIGHYTPNFLQINDKDGYDMLIRVPDSSERGKDNFIHSGAIHILWDVANYSGSNKTIDLVNLADTTEGSTNIGATYGSLTIYGSSDNEWIGDFPVNFFQIGGETDEQKYDMVFRGWTVNNRIIANHNINNLENAGAIYILWDIADYYSSETGKENKTINLRSLDAELIVNAVTIATPATSGSLAIYGAKWEDRIGVNAPEFLQIAGKTGEQKHDMVFSSGYVDKAGDGSNSNDTNEGAIYILWDVADYYSEGRNKAIDLAITQDLDFGATSGLLTIYGRAGAGLGNNDNNILYDTDVDGNYITDADGNKILTNIDGDTDNGGTKDIAFRDKDYTYILFGDKVAVDGNDADDKIDFKTINLETLRDVFLAEDAGFFGYIFNINDGFGVATARTTTKRIDSVGYRFTLGSGSDGNAGYKTLAEVQTAYDTATSTTLSDTDSDLGVWDIA